MEQQSWSVLHLFVMEFRETHVAAATISCAQGTLLMQVLAVSMLEHPARPSSLPCQEQSATSKAAVRCAP